TTQRATQSAAAEQMMGVSPAPAATSDTSGDSSETAFLDCHEELGDEVGLPDCFGTEGSSGGSTNTLDDVKLYNQQAAKKVTRLYGPAYCPTVYSDVSSPHALALANDVMSRIRLPGGIRFMPVHIDSMLYYNGVHWGFSAFALALGSSYFQRLVEITPTLNAAVRHAPPFVAYAAYMRDGAGVSQANQQQQ
ncbi:hypothetical protein Vretifemale_11323, partial [Volvox reticuliferus]